MLDPTSLPAQQEERAQRIAWEDIRDYIQLVRTPIPSITALDAGKCSFTVCPEEKETTEFGQDSHLLPE